MSLARSLVRTFPRSLRPAAAALVLLGVLGAPTTPATLLAAPAPDVAAANAPAPATPDTEQAFLDFRVDAEGNRLLLEIPADRMGQDFLYMNTLATGLGANAPLMDRGQVGIEAVVRLERRGNRVLMMRDNWNVRAEGGSDALLRSARESFPTSVVATFPIDSEDGGTVTVDASSFFMSDVFGVASRLRSAGQGSFQVSRDRSWIDEESSGAFPRNTEIRAVLTFTGDQPGAALRMVAPDGSSITMEQHHSLVALPDPQGFRPRLRDGRSSIFSVNFMDFAQGIDGDYRSGFAARWRLIPSDPAAYLRGELVEPVEPLVFHMDPGIPEPYRTAFIEGGMWWNEILESAGFRNAFHIRDLPEGANPMDARYNMVYWVHRVGPGPSVGPSFRDPRTGEILKTVVRMDSHRSLVNYNIWRGMLPAAGPEGLNVSAEEFTMARRRQHTAHEIGHTIGIAHNFLAGTQGRSTVMDYPAPLVDLDADGRPDLSEAYRPEGGAWDTLAVRYAYTWFPDEASEEEGLDAIMQEAIDAGLRYLTGGHAALSGSDPAATQWVEGSTMFEATERTTRVRRVLMENFDERAIDPGEPMSVLNMRFAHVYLHHRYALHGVVKYLGGMEFNYARRGDRQVPTRILPAAEQRRGMEMALDALEPAELHIPARITDLIPPPGPDTDGSERWLPSMAGPAMDPITLAGGLATEVLDGLLHRERLARVANFHARDAGNPGLDEVLGRVLERTWGAGSGDSREEAELRRVVQRVALDVLLDRAGDAGALPQVRAAAEYHLAALHDDLRGRSGGTPEARAHLAQATRDLERYFDGRDDPDARSRFPVVPLPWP
ncbi:MAG: DUF5117 domain-containing protein [Gemmatimonadales bacterium]|nr:MAG: DUF5117 domain-containing protein [Gemmatimonadales bacterium]